MLFKSDDGRQALEHAVQIEAKELLAQPMVQGYIKFAWRGTLQGVSISSVVELLLNLLFLLPLVALVPLLDYRWRNKEWYLLRLPAVKFGLECAADLALALALTFIPATDLATAPAAPLLLFWVGSGLLWEGRQLISSGSDVPNSWTLLEITTSVRDRFAAYLTDHINRVDATALLFSVAALVVFVSTGDSEDAWATSLRVVAVFLLWFRLFRVCCSSRPVSALS